MKKFVFMLLFTLGGLFNSAIGQNSRIDIIFLGNCGLFMTDGNINLYVDFPYKSGAHHYMTYNPAILDSLKSNAVFLFTHGHSDHYNRKLFKKTGRKLYGPCTITAFLSKKRQYTFQEFNDSFTNFSIEKYRTKHRYSFRHYSYLITWNNKRIYISGDAESSETIGKIKNIDLAFAPLWLLQNAYREGVVIDAKKIILYHHRAGQNIQNNSKDKIIIPTQNQKFEIE